jgi:hypothetical protein
MECETSVETLKWVVFFFVGGMFILTSILAPFFRPVDYNLCV